MPPVSFLTGNAVKWAIARDIFARYGVPLRQETLEVPEIQSLDVAEVAGFSATYASEKLGCSVFKSDVGYEIEALGGFPGPLVKFINKTLTAVDLLAIMQGKTNRRVVIRDCLALKMGGQAPVFFTHSLPAVFSEKISGDSLSSPINQVIVLDGFDKTIASCSPDELHRFWVRHLSHFHELAQYIKA